MARRSSRSRTARRYVLRFCGEGVAPSAHLAVIRSEAEIAVVDFSPPRLLLVRARAARLRAVLRRLPGWAASPERAVPLPSRPALRPRTSP
jgi:hypothetical protein